MQQSDKESVVSVVDPRIVRFVGRHRVMTLATVSEDDIRCCNLFYAYLKPETLGFSGGAFVFTSPEETRHAVSFTAQPRVAASVVLESKLIGRLQGLQIQGTVHRVTEASEWYSTARNTYLTRFPFAAPMLSDLWLLEVSTLKYTDNTLGFGTKLLWPGQ